MKNYRQIGGSRTSFISALGSGMSEGGGELLKSRLNISEFNINFTNVNLNHTIHSPLVVNISTTKQTFTMSSETITHNIYAPSSSLLVQED